jgi:serine/threonine protein kinase
MDDSMAVLPGKMRRSPQEREDPKSSLIGSNKSFEAMLIKIGVADFGMSCADAGQELTAETGTYRYMAPEVIRHESYSSNTDVYSFGICLWQLISRDIPFATMTPIQGAYYAVAEGRRPTIPPSTPRRLQEIVLACWDQDSHKRPSFTYIAMALADYAKMAFSPANIGALTLQIANELLANVEGNSTVNVDLKICRPLWRRLERDPTSTVLFTIVLTAMWA